MSKYTATDPTPPLRAGHYYFTNSPGASQAINTLGVGTLRVAAFLLRKPATLTRLAGEISSAGEAGARYRLGVYADDGNFYPGALLVDAGQINGDSATTQELTISLQLQPGLYWLGGAVQAVTTTQPTVRCASGWTPAVPTSVGTGLPGAGNTTCGWSATGITGALPATFPAGGSPTGIVPRLLVKAG